MQGSTSLDLKSLKNDIALGLNNIIGRNNVLFSHVQYLRRRGSTGAVHPGAKHQGVVTII